FSHWINHMFRGSLESSDIEKVSQLTEVKTMLAEVVEKIEKRGEDRGKQQGIQQGIQQGMQQGMQQARREDARKMLKRGFSVADIADITGLSEQEILSLRRDSD
ncbi:MAG: hypothetical protein EA426_00870, partial [Spirochaetaceae bacterium]